MIVDEALELWGLERNVVTIVEGFSTAPALARTADLIITVPERDTEALGPECTAFPYHSPCRRPRFHCSGI